jgi:hypothetical protein
MGELKLGDELLLEAMQEKYNKLVKLADKAIAKSQEMTRLGSDAIRVHEEFSAIVSSGKHDSGTIQKLEELKNRSKRIEKLRKQSLVKIFDNESNLKLQRDDMETQIKGLKWRIK